MPSSPANDSRQPAGARRRGPEQRRDDGQERLDASQDELTAELARMEDRYKRALADLDNYRKRAAREIERRVAEAGEAMLRDWLRGSRQRRARDPDGAGRAVPPTGLRAVLEQMDAILARERRRADRGGRRARSIPERHEAVAVRDGDDVPDQHDPRGGALGLCASATA